jgi:hypothetical protein
VYLRAIGTLMIGAVLLAGCGSESGSGANTQTRAVTASPLTSEPDSQQPTGTASSAACSAAATPRPDVAGQLPAGFPTVAGWIPTEAVSQGRTKVVRGVVPGEGKDLVAVRDAAVARIGTAGYRETGSDQEPGYEAEADFTGPYEGNINVRPGCRGYLVLTYTINQ